MLSKNYSTQYTSESKLEISIKIKNIHTFQVRNPMPGSLSHLILAKRPKNDRGVYQVETKAPVHRMCVKAVNTELFAEAKKRETM